MNNILQVLLKFVIHIKIMAMMCSGGLFCNHKKSRHMCQLSYLNVVYYANFSRLSAR
ncbi:hypothetical protein FORC066_3454 [Yersinia enterocolitica]|nr:hypothetical protein FORC066_3454 [Yersinia enterocolitica]